MGLEVEWGGVGTQRAGVGTTDKTFLPVYSLRSRMFTQDLEIHRQPCGTWRTGRHVLKALVISMSVLSTARYSVRPALPV